jgi:hypothetical protein
MTTTKGWILMKLLQQLTNSYIEIGMDEAAAKLNAETDLANFAAARDRPARNFEEIQAFQAHAYRLTQAAHALAKFKAERGRAAASIAEFTA